MSVKMFIASGSSNPIRYPSAYPLAEFCGWFFDLVSSELPLLDRVKLLIAVGSKRALFHLNSQKTTTSLSAAN